MNITYFVLSSIAYICINLFLYTTKSLYYNINKIDVQPYFNSYSLQGIQPKSQTTGFWQEITSTGQLSQVNKNNNNLGKSTTDAMQAYYISPTVINLSDQILTQPQVSLLSKGLKFCPSPGEHNQGDLWRDLQKFHRSLRLTCMFNKPIMPKPETIHSQKGEDPSDQSVNNAINVMDNCINQITIGKPFHNPKFKNPSTWNPPGPKDLEHYIARNELLLTQTKPRDSKVHNLTKAEKIAIKELNQLDHIIIKPADKGSACVVLNTCDYKDEAIRQLTNDNYYKKIKQNLTEKHLVEVNQIVNTMFSKGEISGQTLDYLHSDTARTARFYMLPKIHKNKIPPPGRPIVSGNGCPTEKISEFVDFFLNPLSKTFPSYIKDTNHFLQKIHRLKKVPKGTFLFSLDIESLYTNIKHHIGIRFIRAALEKLRPNAKNPSNNSLLILLEAILTKNNFTFNNDHYLQVAGTAMGTKTAPSYANIVVAIFELLYVYTYTLQPLEWFRFIDDIFGLWTHGYEEFEKFIDYLNSRIDGLRFTVEYSFLEISFLDTIIKLHPNGTLTTSLYRKPTDTYNYVLYSSAHPTSCKLGIPYSQFLRIRRICSELSDFDHHSKNMALAFIQRGYPKDMVLEAQTKARNLTRETLIFPLIPKNQEIVVPPKKEVFLVQTYHQGNNPLQQMITNNWDCITKHPHLKAFQNCKLVVANRRPKNLRDLLTSSTFLEKDKKPISKNKCWNPRLCRYCPILNKTGTITSKTTNRTYKTKVNVCCQSSNLIYCIECKKCKIQYVGETSRRLMDRFQGHFSTIKNKRGENKSLIHDHFNQKGHNSTSDLSIFILDFIHMAPKTTRAKSLRLTIEQNWIHRLKTAYPNGLNLDL